MSHEQKNIISDNNAKRLIKFQVFLMCVGVLFLLQNILTNNQNISAVYSNLVFYGGFFISGLIGLLLSLLVIKFPNLNPNLKMLPIHITLLLLLITNFYSFYYGKTVFATFVIFASIAIITPVVYKIEPLIYNALIIIGAICFAKLSYPIVGIHSVIDIFIFVIICSLLSIFIWEDTIHDFLLQNNLEEYKNKMDREIQLAAVVQESFFKHEENIYDDWSLFFYSKSMAGVSGDFFDIFNTDSKLDGIGLFDVSGHGISSGLVTMLVKNIIDQEFSNGKDDKLKTVIDRINVRYKKEKGNIENYMTGILCRTNKDTVDFVNAGHSMPIYFDSKNNTAELLQPEGGKKSFGAIGLDIPNRFNSHSIKMNPGDELFLFTDGVTDAENNRKESFGKERLIKSILRNAERPLTTQINCILSDIKNFSFDVPQKDDITLLILKKK